MRSYPRAAAKILRGQSGSDNPAGACSLQQSSIGQPDLLRLREGRLLFCYSDSMRKDEYMIVAEDGYDLHRDAGKKIFSGTAHSVIDSRGR